MIDIAISIRFVAGRSLGWGVFWREPQPGQTMRQAPRSSRYFATEHEAQQFKAELLAALRQAVKPAEPIAAPRDSVASYLASWLEVHVKPKREAATSRSYEGIVRNHILPAPLDGPTWQRLIPGLNAPTFGDLPMATLRPVIVARLYEDLFARGTALATRKHVHTCLSSACSRAVLDEVLDRNPCLHLGRDLRHKGEEHLEPEPNPFTREEAQRFLAHVKEHEAAWFEYFQFLHDTGVRVGEAAALKWPCIDWERKRAEIVASYSPSDGKDKAPKTHQRRWIDLSDLVVEQLTELRKRQRKAALKSGLTQREYVFTLKNGSPRRQDGNMRRVFDRIVEACKLAGHTPHDLRDTFATLHLSDSYLKLPWVSRQLGHETERTTVEHYFRFLPSTFTKRFANEIRG